jgi:hypothetical protein
LVHVFVRSKADVDSLTATALAALKPGSALWFAYPKKTPAIKTAISRDEDRNTARRAGLAGVSLFAIDDTWSCMRWRPTGEAGARKRA